MFALALALYIAMTRNGNWEGKGKGKHWWQNMEEMGARAKTTPLKMGWKYQSRGQRQGQGQKLMTKHWGKEGKGKNDTTEAKKGQKYQFWGQGQNLYRQGTTDANVRAKLRSAQVKDDDLSVKMMLTQWGLHSKCLQCKRLCPKLSLFVSLMWWGFRRGGWDLR